MISKIVILSALNVAKLKSDLIRIETLNLLRIEILINLLIYFPVPVKIKP